MIFLLTASLAVLIGVFITWILASLITPPSPGGDTDHSEVVAPEDHKHSSETHEETHDHGHDEGDHHHTQSSDGGDLFATICGLAVLAGIIAIIVVYAPSTLTRWSETRAKEKAEEALVAANPDNYWWELWELINGQWSRRASGIRRETKPEGRVTLIWRSDELGGNNITASCIPGHEGAWNAIDGYGNPIERFFSITDVTETEIQGVIERKQGKNLIRPMFKFVRKHRR